MTPERPLDWTDLFTLADEVKAEHGPGSRKWDPQGSKTRQINERVMQALRANGGRIPGELGTIPCLILTTTGAKSGQPRAVPLFCQTVDDRLVIIGSMGGAPRNPPWYHNLVANPEVGVEMDGENFRARAVVLQGAERDHYFGKFAEAYPVFAEYQAGISRVIPIIELRRL